MVVELSVRHIEQNDEKLRANLQTTIERGMVVKNKEMKTWRHITEDGDPRVLVYLEDPDYESWLANCIGNPAPDARWKKLLEELWGLGIFRGEYDEY
ncbi:hypothetical protein LTR09_009656 [Extremus antarcticus]|uniref:Uncharacterized protein n=1 Tax=Extremus antarcticus TaxID=702011 RepID=A0AAJ0DFA6_9PEZI|nr:hypothetical protein LTR09_009656 [Extremus antarcticus]